MSVAGLVPCLPIPYHWSAYQLPGYQYPQLVTYQIPIPYPCTACHLSDTNTLYLNNSQLVTYQIPIPYPWTACHLSDTNTLSMDSSSLIRYQYLITGQLISCQDTNTLSMDSLSLIRYQYLITGRIVTDKIPIPYHWSDCHL